MQSPETRVPDSLVAELGTQYLERVDLSLRAIEAGQGARREPWGGLRQPDTESVDTASVVVSKEATLAEGNAANARLLRAAVDGLRDALNQTM
jgi:hypothetical protein